MSIVSVGGKTVLESGAFVMAPGQMEAELSLGGQSVTIRQDASKTATEIVNTPSGLEVVFPLLGHGAALGQGVFFPFNGKKAVLGVTLTPLADPANGNATVVYTVQPA